MATGTSAGTDDLLDDDIFGNDDLLEDDDILGDDDLLNDDVPTAPVQSFQGEVQFEEQKRKERILSLLKQFKADMEKALG